MIFSENRCPPSDQVQGQAFRDHALGDYIRSELVFDEGDAVAQLQLALLQPLDLDNVGARQPFQRRDRGIEVAMVLQQAPQLRPKLALFLVCHRRPCSRRERDGARGAGGKSLRIIAFWLISHKCGASKVHSGYFRRAAKGVYCSGQGEAFP